MTRDQDPAQQSAPNSVNVKDKFCDMQPGLQAFQKCPLEFHHCTPMYFHGCQLAKMDMACERCMKKAFASDLDFSRQT